MKEENVLPFANLRLSDLSRVGGKNASLGEMIAHLKRTGVQVPGGFATTSSAYRQFLKDNKLEKKIYKLLDGLEVNNVRKLAKVSKAIRKEILHGRFNKEFQKDVKEIFKELTKGSHKNRSFAVRSSATSEDLPSASFAGQQDSFLNVVGVNNVLLAIKKVYASLFNERAIAYRVHNGFSHKKVAISAGVQAMVRSDKAVSGVMFTIDTESGFDKVILINANYGLGESVVKGLINPDEFYLYKPNLVKNRQAILRRNLGSKAFKIVNGKSSKFLTRATCQKNVSAKDRAKFCLNDAEVTELGRLAIAIEKHYGQPMDIEWAKDGVNGNLYIVQARPETVKSRENKLVTEHFSLKKHGEIILTGSSIGEKIGEGKARIILNLSEMGKMRDGEVLVADMTDPDWEPIMKRASAIITNRGGRTCHAAIVARELGIPAIVGAKNATKLLKDGEKITVSCAEGEVGNVYRGLLPIKVDKIEMNHLPKLPTHIYLNLANPNKAFSYQFLPNDGVGLARLEFIISNLIGVHPRAVLRFSTLPAKLKNQILKKTSAYKSPAEYYVTRLTEGIATIAAAFYPKMVIVRLSDFKSNEYANLLGGELFEPKEENPMLGFRGVSRYIADDFAPSVALELAAIKKVRNEMGLSNVAIMLPFLRTVDEAEKVTKLLEEHDLKRGVNGLKVIMMCEIPSNALLAKQFLQYFDGFSIGSNDLTQLTLGVDRDSSLVAGSFDERNLAVKKLIALAISECKKLGKHISICGQAPSDYPEMAEWLVRHKIDGLSLNPDSVVSTWLKLSEM